MNISFLILSIFIFIPIIYNESNYKLSLFYITLTLFLIDLIIILKLWIIFIYIILLFILTLKSIISNLENFMYYLRIRKIKNKVFTLLKDNKIIYNKKDIFISEYENIKFIIFLIYIPINVKETIKNSLNENSNFKYNYIIK